MFSHLAKLEVKYSEMAYFHLRQYEVQLIALKLISGSSDCTYFDPKKGHLEFSGALSWLKFSRRKIFIPIIFGSLDFQLGNPNR